MSAVRAASAVLGLLFRSRAAEGHWEAGQKPGPGSPAGVGSRAGVGRTSAASQSFGLGGRSRCGPRARGGEGKVRFQKQILTGSREGIPAGMSLWAAGWHSQAWKVRQVTLGELFPWTSSSRPPRGRLGRSVAQPLRACHATCRPCPRCGQRG